LARRLKNKLGERSSFGPTINPHPRILIPPQPFVSPKEIGPLANSWNNRPSLPKIPWNLSGPNQINVVFQRGKKPFRNHFVPPIPPNSLERFSFEIWGNGQLKFSRKRPFNLPFNYFPKFSKPPFLMKIIGNWRNWNHWPI